MIARWLMNLLAEFVFRSAIAGGRSFESELTRYMEERGLVAGSSPRQSPGA